jgi:hypothetical protein
MIIFPVAGIISSLPLFSEEDVRPGSRLQGGAHPLMGDDEVVNNEECLG